MVDPITGSACYQPADFVGRGFSGASINLLYHGHMNERNALYLCTAIEKAARSVAAYTNLFNSDRLASALISLPVRNKTVPDYSIIEQLFACGGGIDSMSIDTSTWKTFILNDIFALTNGNRFDKNKMSHNSPSINFVSRTSVNNGISDVVDLIDCTDPYPAGAITLAFGGSIGSCFVQDKPFYTGQNVGVILMDDEVPKNARLFIASCIEKTCKAQFVAFSDEINKHFKTDLSIKLPVKTEEEIDFDYMEKYIRAIEKLTIAKLYAQRGKEIEIAKSIVA